jgi:protein-export chaperone SecB
MNPSKKDLSNDIKLVKHYIKDLSFENLQHTKNLTQLNNEVKITDNIKAIYQSYNNDNFSVLLRYSCDCNDFQNDKKIFILEIDYFGLFKIINRDSYSQDMLTSNGCVILYPFLRSIIEDIIAKGGPFKVSLKNLKLNLTND